MSAADLLEDGFPHSTADGYRAGCQGHACPGVVDNGISCADAFARYQGDYGYRKKVDAGMSAKEIIAAEQAAVASAPKPRPVPKPTAEPLAEEFQAELDDLLVEELDDEPDDTKPEPIPADVTPKPKVAEPKTPKADKPAARKRAEIRHGTYYGYQRGCRDEATCPAPDGKTCIQAHRDYLNDYAARRRKNGGQQLLESSKLAARDARIAELEALLAEARAPFADGTGRHRAEVTS